jgi:hypothetical protein
LLFLHVGKTGGTSVASWLSKMNIPAVHVHVHPLLPSVAQRLGNQVVISVRDPIERVLSAFNYERARNKSFWRPMDDCFASLNDLVEQAFLTTRSTPACRKMARAVPPNGWSRASGHLGLGFCHYLSGAMPLLRHNRVWLVRQETMAADLGGLARWLGLHNSTALRLPIPKLTRTHRKDPPLSAAARQLLRDDLLSPEYALLDRLEQLAANGKRNTGTIALRARGGGHSAPTA